MKRFALIIVRSVFAVALVVSGSTSPGFAQTPAPPTHCQRAMQASLRTHIALYQRAHRGQQPASKSAKVRLEKAVLTRSMVDACGGLANTEATYTATLSEYYGSSTTSVPAVAVAGTPAPASDAACANSILQARQQLLLKVQSVVHGTTFTFITFNRLYRQNASQLLGCGTSSVFDQAMNSFQVHQQETQDYTAIS